ncbi:hypothetical protein TNCV_3439991 [Trichonephila clavipes]|uniref:Uncharacterized protein n=1 Tax=Trichonephila clavipes TaxID=2585209 RepID=A0A8X6W5Z5_TRICX|nr:hypothetical protein TNCV_3439991 [Trichonephila clavipes]
MFLAGHPSQGCFGLQSHCAPCYFFNQASFYPSDFSFSQLLLLVSSSSIEFLKFTASISETQIDDNRCRNIMEVNNGRILIIFCYMGNRSIGATENVRVRMLENSVNHRSGNLWHRERTSYSAHESDVTRGYYPLAALERPVRSLSENFERRFENFVENECCLLTHKHQFGTLMI